MFPSRSKTMAAALLGSILLITLSSLSCNLPTALRETFGIAGTSTPTPEPTNTPQPLPPTIVETDPPRGSTISLKGPITIYFNQAMDQDSVEGALSGNPETQGSLEWLDSATLRFHPGDPFPTGAPVQLLLSSGARAANGLSLTEEIRMQFYTPDNLQLITVLPSPKSIEVDPLSAIAVTFNQPVVPLGADPADAPPAFSISPLPAGRGEWINTSTYQYSPDPGLAGGLTYRVELNPDLVSTWGASFDSELDRSWSFSTAYPELLNWEPYDGDNGVPLDAAIRFQFSQSMDPASVEDNFSLINGEGANVPGKMTWSDDYKEAEFQPDSLLSRAASYAAVLPSEASSAGGTALGVDTRFNFETTGEFQFLGTPSGQSYTTSIYEGATLYFNNPIDLETVEENISFIPEIGDFWPSTGGSGNVLNLYGSYEPLTTYTLVMKESLADSWGSQLDTNRSIQFTTQALSPNLTVTQGNNILYLTGTENAIPVQGTNLYQLSINQGRIPLEDIPLFFGSGLYQTLDDYYPADVQYWTQVVNVPGDDTYTINLPVNPQGTALAPGLYRYQIYSQELPYNPSPYLLAVSDIHLTMKTSPENLLIWALDLRSGEPVPEAEISVYDQNGEALFSGTTDQDGIFQADFPAPVNLYDQVFYAISGEPGTEDFGITASNWAFSTEPYNFGLRTEYGAPQPTAYIYTDRPIYRPGQTVNYRLVLRDPQQGGYALPQEDSISLSIFQSGKEEQQVDLTLSEYGTASGSLELSSYAQPGYYRLETDYGMTLFQVAEYRKPEIDLSVSLVQEESLVGEDWQGSVEARYYFDAPADGVDLSWRMRAAPTSFSLPGYQVGEIRNNWFSYGDLYSMNSYGVGVDGGEAQTDQNGRWEGDGKLTNLDLNDREVSLPAKFILSVTAQDESGFQVSNQAEMLVHPSDFYIGVHPSTWIAEADQTVDFDLLVVDWDREPDGVHSLQAEFKKVTWNYQVGEIGQMEYTREEELISRQTVTTDQNGEAAFNFKPDQPGTYQLDVFGDGARTEVTLWVGGPGTTSWPELTNQKVKLTADQPSYLPGDTAEIFIPNPFPAEAQALITLERNKVIRHETMTISGSGTLLQVDLDEGDAPNVYLSATLISADPEGEVGFRQGYINLLVDPGEKILNVEILGEPKRLGPGEEVQFTIRVTDQAGVPQQGEFSLAVVDKAVLALADPFSPDIVEAFYDIQPLSVRMGFPLGMHAGLSVFVAGGMGGGGADVDSTVRDQFEDTGYWQADVVTDENGEAIITVQLPDNLTTWQADTRGVTKDSLVGQADTEVVTTKDLLVRPVTPRFLVAGDHLVLAAIVHNNTTSTLTADVTLQANGLLLDLPEFSTQTVDIPAGGRTRVEWWGEVEDTEQADLTFLAEAGEYRDAVKPYQGPLPVLRYLAPVSFGTSGVLDQPGEELEIVSLPRSYDPSAGSLDIELSPSLAAAVLNALDALEEREPYSNEATLSYFLPNAVTYQTLQELDLDYPRLESRLESIIPDTLDALAAAQNEDGGWGWWQGGASDSEISSYILFGLLQAQKSGVFVDDLMIQQGTGYLMATLPALDMLAEPWQYDRLALRYFVLTEAGINVQAGMEGLADRNTQLSPGYQALLALALDSASPGNQRTQTLLSNLGGTAIRTATGVHWENSLENRSWINSDTTTTAMVIYAMAQVDNAPDILPDAVRYLVSTKTSQGDWWSLYETSWSILALNEILKSTDELSSTYDFSAAVNGRELISGSAAGSAQLEAVSASLPIENLYSGDPNALVVQRSAGSGSLYYKAHLLIYRPAEEVQPYGKGLSLSRVYREVNPLGNESFTQSGTVGKLIRVQLTLVVEHDTHYLMIEDYLPSGAEVLDTRLKTSRQDLGDYQVSAPFQEGWGWWYFNAPKVYDDRISWSASLVPAGTYQISYLLSLTTPGEFQILPARTWQLYFPETMAISAGDKFVIESGD